MTRSNTERSSIRFPAILFIVVFTLAVTAVMVYSFYIASDLTQRFSPVVDTLENLKFEVANVHIWIEETLSGDVRKEKPELLYDLLETKKKVEQIIADSENGRGLPLISKTPEIRIHLRDVLKKSVYYEALAEARFSRPESAGIGSGIDQQFDRLFESLIDSADKAKNSLKRSMFEQLSQFQTLQGVLIVTVLLSGLGFSIIFSRYEHGRVKRLAMLQNKEERLEKANRHLKIVNQELKAFSYSVSHDLKAPLRHILGYSQMLQKDHKQYLDEQGRKMLEFNLESAEKMNTLIDSLLKLSNVQRKEFRPQKTDLADMARRIHKELSDYYPQRTVNLVVSDSIIVDADSDLLKIAMDNLMANAWKFSSKVENASIEVGETVKDGKRVFFVADNGIGFDMSQADQLFMPFQRLHPRKDFEGTGVGLATVQRVVHRHGGQIWAESEPGEGATFFFTL